MRNLMLGGLMAATFLSPAALNAAVAPVDPDTTGVVPTSIVQLSEVAGSVVPGLGETANQQRERRGERGTGARADGARGDRGDRANRGNRDRSNRQDSNRRQDRAQRGQGRSIRAQQDAALAQAQRMARQSRSSVRTDRRDTNRDYSQRDQQQARYRNDRRDRNDRRERYDQRNRYERRDRDQRYDRNRNYDRNDRYGSRVNYGNRQFVYNGRSFNNWNNGWRNNNRYNWRSYRNNNRRLYSGSYNAPYRNYRYSRLSIGGVLGSLFYSNRYQINDPYRYRLPEVYGPYRWVRYYGDAVLVDVRNGRTVDVVYDFFY